MGSLFILDLFNSYTKVKSNTIFYLDGLHFTILCCLEITNIYVLKLFPQKGTRPPKGNVTGPLSPGKADYLDGKGGPVVT